MDYFKKAKTPMLLLGGGIVIFLFLVFSKSSPQAKIQQTAGALVVAVEAVRSNEPVIINGTGSVTSVSEAKIAPQVGGQVVWIDPKLIVGGRFKQGEPMFRLEKQDYLLKVEMAGAEVAAAERDLEIAKANARVANEEWEMMTTPEELSETKSAKRKPNPLVLFEPQLKSARAKLMAAKAQHTQAKLDLDRTAVTAPFNCFVREESVDLGQYLRMGDNVATLIGTDAVEVIVPVTLEEYSWVKGAMSGADKPLNAFVTVGGKGFDYSWEGQISRTLGDVDTRGRMHRLVVRVDSPYGEHLDRAEQNISLSVGMFARVAIQAGMLKDTFVIPRSALRQNSTVWVFGEENSLVVAKVKVARLTNEKAYISSGLEIGQKVILTSLSGAVPGLKLRLAAEESK